jgi:hypothetical protein
VETGDILDHWDLSRGFERLTYAGGRFLLVREEEVEGKPRTWQTVVRELVVRKPPKIVRVIRPAQAGEMGFFTSSLTPDGAYYLWVGPRRPPQNYRSEVWEVATGHQVKRIAHPMSQEVDGWGGSDLSPDGRYLWLDDAKRLWLYDLAELEKPSEKVGRPPIAVSPGWKWVGYQIHNESQGLTLALHRENESAPWLLLSNNDVSNPQPACFSPNGRYLAWGSTSGSITVVDLLALEKEVEEFEKKLQAK